MDKPISVGDLVVVVKPVACGCEDRYMGLVFRVPRIRMSVFPRCVDCKKSVRAQPVAEHGGNLFELPRLKRIPPLSELEGEKRDEEIAA